MGRFDLVAIGASAGGIRALARVLSMLPPNFPVPVVIVQHRAPQPEGHLADSLRHSTGRLVKDAEHQERLLAGRVYLAPPARHLLVGPDLTALLSDLPRVHFSRPSVDTLFESVALNYPGRAVAVVLTGSGSDGAVGAEAIKASGGFVIVQSDPEVSAMPSAAIQAGAVDLILPVQEIASALANLVPSS